jgi:uncharacterized membrane protein
MNIAADVFKELLGMFLADARLAVAILLLVAIVGALVAVRVEPFLAGGVLLVGCLSILAGTVSREARGKADR